MAKGTLVFEFESALDLENQMRAYLRLPLLREVVLKEAEKAPDTAAVAAEQAENDRRLEHAIDILGCVLARTNTRQVSA